MLSIRDLHAYYGKSHVLQGVSLDVPRGEIVSVLGRNGVGRSTMLKAIMNFVVAKGSVLLEDQQLLSLLPHEVARLGVAYVPENRDVFPDLTVHQNLMLGAKPRSDGKVVWTVDELMRRFQRLSERFNVPAGVLSGGEQQLLTICRSLLGNPKVILVDEPTEGLAPRIVSQVSELLVEIAARGSGVLLIEQKLTIALDISSKVHVMGHGHIVFSGSSEELKASPQVSSEWLAV